MDLEQCQEKVKELEESFSAFLLNLSDQQIEWLRDVRNQHWTESEASKEAHALFTHAFIVGVSRSVAFRVIRAAIIKAGCQVPANLHKIAAVIYK
jgi:hypothetical protein